MNTLIAALGAAAVVAGIIGVISGLRKRVPQPPRPKKPLPAWLSWSSFNRKTKALLAVGVVTGLIVSIFSGIILLLFVVPLAIVGLPALLGKQDTGEKDLLSALETWARSLASASETGAFTLREVLEVTRASTPEILRIPVDRLHTRMSGSWTNAEAIRAFADDMDSAWVDQVAIQLLEAAEFSPGGLSNALQSLADSLAAEVKNRMEIYVEREKPRRTLVFMTGITAVTLAGIIFFSRTDQLSGYRTPIGSALLAVIVAVFLGLLIWSKRITRTKPEPRILINDDPVERA